LLEFFKKIKKNLKKNGYLLLTTPDFDSPMAKLFDYHLMYPPHHQTILSPRWLTKFFHDNNLFKLAKQESACILLEKYDEWFSFYKKTCPTPESQSVVDIFNFLHSEKPFFKKFEEKINSVNLGSETILLFQK